MWMAIFAGFGIVCFVGMFFIWHQFGKFKIVQKLSGGKKWLKRVLSAIPVLGIIAFLVMRTVPAAVCFVHLLIIWIVCDFIGGIINKKTKKEPPVYASGIVALLITGVYLTIAWYLGTFPVSVNYTIQTDKVSEGEKLRVVMFSDSHIGSSWGGEKLADYIHEMGELNPDILVIVGDYVDDDTKLSDMEAATRAFADIKTTYGIYYVFGNHDKGYYNRREFTQDDLRSAFASAGVKVLEDEVIRLNDSFILIGRQDASNKKRAEIKSLTDMADTDSYIIDLNHQPTDHKAERAAGVDLVLSGHTHAGQLLPINYMGELFGLNDQTFGLRDYGDMKSIVSAGISSWALPFKTGCRSDYMVIDIVGTGK